MPTNKGEFEFEPNSPNNEHAQQAPRKRQAKERAPPKPRPALYKASVGKLANTGPASTQTPSNAGIEEAILQRIQKCLQRANHPTTPEAEAKAALYVASRLMARHNVSQADLLAHEPPAVQQRYAGESIVAIQRSDGEASAKPVPLQGWARTLLSAMMKFFDCNSYTTGRYSSMQLTFYGIAENTVAAAMAFEMAYNLIAEWARPYKGVGSKNSYCIGAAKELESMARDEKFEEEEKARKAERESLDASTKQEAEQRRAELARLVPLPDDISSTFLDTIKENGEDGGFTGSTMDGKPLAMIAAGEADNCHGELEGNDIYALDSDDYDDEIKPDFQDDGIDLTHLDDGADILDEILKLVKPEPGTSEPSFDPLVDDTKLSQNIHTSPIPVPVPEGMVPLTQNNLKQGEEKKDVVQTSLWASSMQLTTFRLTARKIADDYIKGKGIKLRSSRRSESSIRDSAAYMQGTRDAQKIDVRRNRIEG